MWYLVRALRLFKAPLPLLRSFLTMTAPPGRLVELRSGLKIYLSSHPHDAVTVFLLFAEQEYGKVRAGSVVVDIGANIGVFSLYAARSGAARIHAYEPNAESYECLVRNIGANRLKHVIFPRRVAVTATSGARVKFPKPPSPYNAVLTADGATDFDWVDTVNLRAIVGETGAVDLLKLDCEGSEYDILLGAGADVYERIKAIRLEYHAGRGREIESHLSSYGFVRCHAKGTAGAAGTLWFEKRGNQGSRTH